MPGLLREWRGGRPFHWLPEPDALMVRAHLYLCLMHLWLLTPSAVEAEAIQRGLPQDFSGEVHVTGVGALATLHTLWRLWQSAPHPSALLALGIAGSYTGQLAPGSAVWVEWEIWGDLGKRKPHRFVLAPPHLLPSFPCELQNSLPCPLPLPTVIGLTLHSVSGSPAEARYWQRTYPHAHIESQEGFAYFLFAHTHRLPFACIRIISNRAGARRWDFSAAWQSLSHFCARYLSPLAQQLALT